MCENRYDGNAHIFIPFLWRYLVLDETDVKTKNNFIFYFFFIYSIVGYYLYRKSGVCLLQQCWLSFFIYLCEYLLLNYTFNFFLFVVSKKIFVSYLIFFLFSMCVQLQLFTVEIYITRWCGCINWFKVSIIYDMNLIFVISRFFSCCLFFSPSKLTFLFICL